jgi:hypothetical protein
MVTSDLATYRQYHAVEKATDQLQIEVTKLKRMTVGHRSAEEYKRARAFMENEMQAAWDALEARIKEAIDG